MRFDFRECGIVDERALRGASFEARGWLQVLHSLSELCGERVVDSILHVEAIRTDAGLAGVAILRGGSSFDGGVDVGVVENDEGRVSSKLKRDFFDRAGALRHQEFADLS